MSTSRGYRNRHQYSTSKVLTSSRSLLNALLHLGDIELDMRLELQVFVMRTVHLVLDVLLQIGHLTVLV